VDKSYCDVAFNRAAHGHQNIIYLTNGGATCRTCSNIGSNYYVAFGSRFLALSGIKMSTYGFEKISRD
jgi:hypothetical protein